MEREIKAVDWGGKKGKLALISEHQGNLVSSFPKDLETLILGSPNCVIAIETTFDSFKKEKEKHIDLASSVGSDIWVFPTRQTDRWRKKLGITKSDAGDAHLLYHLAKTKPNLFSVAKKRELNKFQTGLYDEFQDTLVDIRVELNKPEKDQDSSILQKYEVYKPDFRTMPDFAKEVFIDKEVHVGKPKHKAHFKETALYTALVAAVGVLENGGNREDFDRCLSITSWRRKSIFSSNVHYHVLKWMWWRDLGVTNNKLLYKLNEVDDETKEAACKLRKRQVRKAMRWMFHHCKQVRDDRC